MSFNNQAWSQRHSPAFAGPYADRGDRHLCPDCGAILSRQWFQSIFGCEPEQYRVHAYPFTDPSDDRIYNREQRSPR